MKNIWKKITCASAWGRNVCPFRGAETPFFYVNDLYAVLSIKVDGLKFDIHPKPKVAHNSLLKAA